LGFTVQPLFATELKTELLPQKMGQLLNMQEKAAKKLLLASEIFEHLNHRMDELRREILEIQKQMKIVSFTNAIQSARIRHNLMLMGQIQVYVTKLDGKIEKLEATRAKLNFLYQLLEDELKIIETVNHMEIARLMKRVDETIHGNAWLDQTHLFEVEGMVLPEPRKIWRNLIIKK
jgi:limonene-1,2-epoxide hydrolase